MKLIISLSLLLFATQSIAQPLQIMTGTIEKIRKNTLILKLLNQKETFSLKLKDSISYYKLIKESKASDSNKIIRVNKSSYGYTVLPPPIQEGTFTNIQWSQINQMDFTPGDLLTIEYYRLSAAKGIEVVNLFKK